MHHQCYNDYMQVAYKCPVCKKSAVNMELQWQKLDDALQVQPMPPQFREAKASVRCNDCGAKSWTMYHWLGNKCTVCDSYNTDEVEVVGLPERDGRPVTMQRRDRERPALEGRLNGHRPGVVPSPGSGSYFLEPTTDEAARPSTSDSVMGIPTTFSPYDMLQRVSRSFSPIRNYLANREADMENNPEEVDFWGSDGRFLSGEED